MVETARYPIRHAPIHLPSLETGNRPIIQFVTVCVDRRRPLLARPDIHALLIATWRSSRNWIVGRYVLMPDHLHLFCAPAARPIEPLRRWVQHWRAEITRRWPRPEEKPIWQRDFFDRQLRTGESYSRKWLYAWENPKRAGMVVEPREWPFQGELNVLKWHEP